MRLIYVLIARHCFKLTSNSCIPVVVVLNQRFSTSVFSVRSEIRKLLSNQVVGWNLGFNPGVAYLLATFPVIHSRIWYIEFTLVLIYISYQPFPSVCRLIEGQHGSHPVANTVWGCGSSKSVHGFSRFSSCDYYTKRDFIPNIPNIGNYTKCNYTKCNIIPNVTLYEM